MFSQKKCEIYWPENVNEKMFLGEIIVEVVSISDLPNYTLRTITLQLVSNNVYNLKNM